MSVNPEQSLANLYGPAWAEVTTVIDRVASLSAAEHSTLAAVAKDSFPAPSLGGRLGGAGPNPLVGFLQNILGAANGVQQVAASAAETQAENTFVAKVKQAEDHAKEVATKHKRDLYLQTAVDNAVRFVTKDLQDKTEVQRTLALLERTGEIRIVANAVGAALVSDLDGTDSVSADEIALLREPWLRVVGSSL